MAERTDDAILFEEIDDELRQDQANKLWQAYGKYIVALCIAIILSVGGYHSQIKNECFVYRLAHETGQNNLNQSAKYPTHGYATDKSTQYSTNTDLHKNIQ